MLIKPKKIEKLSFELFKYTQVFFEVHQIKWSLTKVLYFTILNTMTALSIQIKNILQS